jgi:uncharacterized membrane protein YbhN (UPF0104 family)
MTGRRTKTLWALLRALLGLALLAFVVTRLDARQVFANMADLVWGWVALACLAQLVAKLVWTARWKEILCANGLQRGFRDLLALVFVGLFFNSFLPTSMGGDVVRGYYTSRGREDWVASYGSLLIERALGLITLSAQAAGVALILLAQGDNRLSGDLLMGVAVVGAGLTIVGFSAFRWTGWPSRLRAVPWIRGRGARLLDGLSRAIDLFNRPSTPRLAIVANSLALQITAALFHVACARAVGLDTPALVFFLVVPASVLASMLPISLNGLGLREGTLVGLLVAYGAPPAEAGGFAILALFVASAFSLIGGLIYPFYRVSASESTHVSADT